MVEGAEHAIADAERLLCKRSRRADAAELLRYAVSLTRDPTLLQRIVDAGLAGALRTPDSIARRLLWDGIVVVARRRLQAALALGGFAHPALWASGDDVVAGKIELRPEALVLACDGAGSESIPYGEIVAARVAGRADEAVEGRATLVLQHRRGTILRIGIRNPAVFGSLVASFA